VHTPTEKKRLPPEDIIREDSGPPVTEVPKPKPGDVQVDADDAMIDQPKDEVFKKDDQSTRRERR
jgi:hypothetical protein